MKYQIFVSESDREKILLLHNKFYIKRNLVETTNLNFNSHIILLKDELEFLKEVHLHRISMLNGINKNIYLRTVQNDYAFGLFENNSNILERFSNQFLYILNESITDFRNELDKLNLFIIESFKISLIEQPESRFASGQELDVIRVNQKASGDVLTNAINYIKKKGVPYIFETLREALSSGKGTAIQIALSFTGAGSIAVTVAWGVLGLYDLYQLVVNGNTRYLGNFLIDLICCVTAGVLAKPLSKLIGKAFVSVKVFMEAVMKSSAGTVIISFIQKIISGLKIVMSYIGQAATYMKTKMGIGWVSNLTSKVEKYYNMIVEFFKKFLENQSQRIGIRATSMVLPQILRTSAALAAKFEPTIFSKIAQLDVREIGEYVGVELNKTILKIIDKEVQSNFKEQPTENFLRWVDKTYGTKYGDIYLSYINGKKLYKYNNDKKYLKVSEVGANTVRGDIDYSGEKSKSIEKGTSGLISKI